MNKSNQCGYCLYYDYDEELDEHYCSLNIDQDDAAKMRYNREASCPYFRIGNEYTIINKQGFK